MVDYVYGIVRSTTKDRKVLGVKTDAGEDLLLNLPGLGLDLPNINVGDRLRITEIQGRIHTLEKR